MDDPEIERRAAESLRRGRAVARAVVVGGPGRGRALLVWPAGETWGDLGTPRLNQRVALFAEQLFERQVDGGDKRFDADGSSVAIAVEILRPPA